MIIFFEILKVLARAGVLKTRREKRVALCNAKTWQILCKWSDSLKFCTDDLWSLPSPEVQDFCRFLNLEMP